MRYQGSVRLGAILLLASVLAACTAVGAGSTPVPAATPKPADALGVFSGFQRCREDTARPADADPDITYAICDQSASDPRLTGELKWQSGIDTSGPIGMIWSSGVLTNAGGSWSCDEMVLGLENGVGGKDMVCVGAGDYVGLTAYAHGVTHDEAITFGLIGWVEKSR